MSVQGAVRSYYTDILCHEFSPFTGERISKLLAGTNFGDVYMIRSDNEEVCLLDPSAGDDESTSVLASSQNFSPTCSWHRHLGGPNDDEPVISIAWENEQKIFLLSNRRLYQLIIDDAECGESLETFYQPSPQSYEIMDFSLIRQLNAICLVCDDWKTRILDEETLKITSEFQDHDGIVQVCKSTSEYLATGGMDGIVHLYDGRLRTNKKICSFGSNKSPVNNVEMSRNSVWLAVSGVESSEYPAVYNIRSKKQIPIIPSSERVNETERICALHIDSYENLYWGGGMGSVYKSDDLLQTYSELKATYGIGSVPQILSITTEEMHGGTRISVAGATNAILFSSRGLFWDSMIHLYPSEGK